jgi:hypothetical protein
VLRRISPQARASAALVTLQRNSFALETLRTRLESEICLFSKSEQAKDTGGYQELTVALGLVREGEHIISELAGRIETAGMLDEFIAVIDSAALSLNKIKNDIERLVPSAEAVLEDLSRELARLYAAETLDLDTPQISCAISLLHCPQESSPDLKLDQKEGRNNQASDENTDCQEKGHLLT